MFVGSSIQYIQAYDNACSSRKVRVPDGAARLKHRPVGWNRAGWELNTLDSELAGTFLNV